MPNSKASNRIPFSIRLTKDEHAQLKAASAGLSMADYVRSRIFSSRDSARKPRGKFPVKDQEAVARVLGRLGSLELGRNFRQLAEAAHIGCLEVTPETEAAISSACKNVQEIRRDLILALGLRTEKQSRIARFNEGDKP